MDLEVLKTILEVAGSVIGSYVLINWRLTALEKKVDTHNGYAEKFASTTTDIALIKQDINYIKEKLEEVK